jgi:hypothetical protein
MIKVLPQRWCRPVTIFATVLAMATLLLAGASRAGAANANPRILPPNSHASGKTYGGWSAAWWQWAIAQPTDHNAQLDPTGAFCGVGQSGHVFFLAGTLNPGDNGVVTRNDCVVPAGKALYFPLVNAFNVDCSSPCTDGDALTAWNQLEDPSSGFKVTGLFATIDGIKVQNLDPQNTPYRACAAPVAGCTAPGFDVTLPAENPFGAPAGVYGTTVADGVYLLIPPLPPGAHTIEFGGTSMFNGGSNTEDTTYNLVVSSK